MDAHTAQQIDTQLAELWSEANTLRTRLAENKLSLAHSLGIRPRYVTKTRREVTETVDELLAMAQERLPGMMAWEQTALQEKMDKRATYEAQLAACRAKAQPLEQAFEADPWPRFFLVNNTGGHIHSSMQCSTCNFRTSFSWLPALSGLTEKDAVDAHGPHLCSVCFPTAPVEWRASDEKPVDPNECPGSGTHEHDSSGLQYASPRARCNHCHQTVSVTSTYKLRKHKRAA